MAALLFNVSRLTLFFAKNYTSKMYKTVKTQTNLPVKICHLKVCLSNSGRCPELNTDPDRLLGRGLAPAVTFTDVRRVNSMAIYECRPNFASVGILTRTCLKTSSGLVWSEPEPMCVGKCISLHAYFS